MNLRITLALAGAFAAAAGSTPSVAQSSSWTQRQNELAQLRARVSAHNARCGHVPVSETALVSACEQEKAELSTALAAYEREAATLETARPNAVDADGGVIAPGERVITRDGRSYRASGNGMVGGTTWITGYNVQNAEPAVVKKAHEMMAEQMRLAGEAYDDGIDFQHYNFVLGIAASTNALVDLANRVVFDEYKNGQFSAETQTAYNSLKGRQFDELACHSNGAMVCLAALENRDVVVGKVVLYGPQITVESLKMWDQLMREHKVGSVQIYVNSGDPVPPVSLAIGGGMVGSYIVSSMALMRPANFVDVIHETAPELSVRTLSCATTPDLDCHGMTVYNRNVQQIGCGAQPLAHPPVAVPGTTLPGRPNTASMEPPPPC